MFPTTQPAPSNTGTPALSALQRPWLSLVLGLVMMGAGIWFRLPTIFYEGPPEQLPFNGFSLSRLIYSDISSLYFRDGLSDRPIPYVDYQLEYPVGMGFAIYMLNAAQTLRGYFLATSFFLLACGLATIFLVREFPQGRPLLLALSPALAFYVNLNWDLWGILPMVVALLLFVRGHCGLSAAVMALAVWTKFFPIVLLPLMVLDRARCRQWRDVAIIAYAFVLVTIAMNAPVLLLQPEGWLHFFKFSQDRATSIGLWALWPFNQSTLTQMNLSIAVLLLVGMAVILWRQWRSDRKDLLALCCASVAWFMLVNKAYSPQYDLWIVVLLALAGVTTALAIAWSASAVLTFGATFLYMGVFLFPGADESVLQYGLLPVTVLREIVLVVVVVLCLVPQRRWPNLFPNPTSSIGRSEPDA